MRKIFILFFLSLYSFNVKAQISIDSFNFTDKSHLFSYKKLIVPATLITYGTLSLFSENLIKVDLNIKNYSQSQIATHTKIDNYLQFVPAIGVYALNVAGLKGKHDFKDRTIIFLSSQIITSSLVLPLKYISHQQRPNQTNFFSFPSGHTAMAFSGAHFFFREYREKNVFLAISAYPIAMAVGGLRISNNKHWFSNVAAGAGIGILSTELAYWAFPAINKHLKFSKHNIQAIILPVIGAQQFGVSCLAWF
ncbi:MAG TPA: phosphatase PAP2 family protein [Edaphocola sp.]|nr:phosphatase PAP2 family protein [Edaphocola sp.]